MMTKFQNQETRTILLIVFSIANFYLSPLRGQDVGTGTINGDGNGSRRSLTNLINRWSNRPNPSTPQVDANGTIRRFGAMPTNREIANMSEQTLRSRYLRDHQLLRRTRTSLALSVARYPNQLGGLTQLSNSSNSNFDGLSPERRQQLQQMRRNYQFHQHVRERLSRYTVAMRNNGYLVNGQLPTTGPVATVVTTMPNGMVRLQSSARLPSSSHTPTMTRTPAWWNRLGSTLSRIGRRIGRSRRGGRLHEPTDFVSNIPQAKNNKVAIAVYDLHGRLVLNKRQLIQNDLESFYQLLPPGVYSVLLNTFDTKKILVTP